MTLAPRFLVKLWAGFLAARLARRLRSPEHDARAQTEVFEQLMAHGAGTEFAREHGLKPSTFYAQFRDAVPLRTHDYFEPLVARMVAGEPDVLVPGRCRFFVETAGTTGLAPRLLPAPEEMLAHYRAGLHDAVLLHAIRARHPGVFLGRHAHVGGSTALTPEGRVYRGGLDAMLALCLSPWAEANLYVPAPDLARLPEGEEKTARLAEALWPCDVTLLGGTSAAVAALAEHMRGRDEEGRPVLPHLRTAWPNLECFLYHGATLGLFGESLRASMGPGVAFHEIYASAEGIFAAQDDNHQPGLRLLTNLGVFYEFLPLEEYQEDKLAAAALHCVPLAKAKPGIDYVLVVTTPAGLRRVVIGDIIRFTSIEPPRLQVIGRTGLYLNSFGEQVTERELLDTMQAVCARNGWRVVTFHVAPVQQRFAAGQALRCHEWWLELHTHTIKTPTANVLAPELDAELAMRNRDYAARRNDRMIHPPHVRLVMPGIFAQWAAQYRKTAATSKMPRCRSDRLIADQLADLAGFHPETNAPFPTTSE